MVKQLKKDIFKGRSCWILGTGPSILKEDLTLLKDEITIGVNGITDLFIPTYLCISDNLIIGRYPSIKLSLYKTFSIIAKNYVKDISSNYSVFLDKKKTLLDIDDIDPSFETVHWGKSVTLDLAIPLAIYLGFSTIYLLGMDATDSPKGHATGKFSSGHAFSRKKKYWIKMKEILDKHGIKIINCTQGSNIDIFPFDSLKKIRRKNEKI